MLTLYQFEISPFCDKIRRILNVKRVPYAIEEVPPTKTLSVVRKLNPAGKLPFLVADGAVVADSTDIAYWLEAHHPEPRLVPEDPRERGLCHVLEDWADESLYFYEMRLRFTLPNNARRFIPELVKYEGSLVRTIAPYAMPFVLKSQVSSQGVGKRPLDVVLRDVERHVDALAGILGDGAWLVGDRLTIADVSVFAQLFCIRASDEGGRIVAARPAVAAWMERVDRATAPGAAAAGAGSGMMQ
ncbi:glutathione S-transferase family protein [Candidatus Binatia bacterium]|nr:glutathione S-transferase family protein [Candidatus Binatia bacterium]